MLRRARRAVAVAALLCGALAPIGPATAGATKSVRDRSPEPATPATQRHAEALAVLPMAFEPNVGQTDERVKFLARGRGYTVFLTDDVAVLSLGGSSRPATLERPSGAERVRPFADVEPSYERPRRAESEALYVRIEGARDGVRMAPERELPGKTNYLVGADEESWRRDVPTYGAVRYEGVYDGIDTVFYGTQQHLEYDFVVRPGADPGQIRVRFEGQQAVSVDASGEIVLTMRGGEVRQQRAVVYQEDGAGRRLVKSRYVLGADGEVRFDVEAYDRASPLIIDPVIVYEGYLGGGRSSDSVSAVALDASGAIYLGGSTSATDFPVSVGAYDTQLNSAEVDAFVMKLDPSGAAVVFATYLGGLYGEHCAGVGVDPLGSVYLAGYTESFNFPTTPDAYDRSMNGIGDLFLAQFDPSGSSLVYSTFAGSTSIENIEGFDFTGGSVYLTGWTDSQSFPTTPGAYDTSYNGQWDVFVMKWSTAPWELTYSTFIGGESFDRGASVVADASGAAYVTGETRSILYPTSAGALDTLLSGTSDAFVTKVAADGGSLHYSTFLGGSSFEEGSSIAVDGQGAAYVAGTAHSGGFPTTPGAYDTTFNGIYDAFVAKVAPSGSSLVYSTFLGGAERESLGDIAVDASGAAFVTGGSESADYPTTALAYDRQLDGATDVVATKLAADGQSLVYSTFVGGTGRDGASAIAVDASGGAYVAGATASSDFPVVGGMPGAQGDGAQGFVTRISPTGASLASSTYVGGVLGNSDDVPGDLVVDATGAVYLVGTTGATNFPSTPGAYAEELAGQTDVFVTKLSPGGASLVYSTFLGGAEWDDVGSAIAVGDSGEAFIAGTTLSADFPTTPGAFDSTHGGASSPYDMFVAKLSADGSALVYSTFVGGSLYDEATAIAVDAAGNAYVAGATSSTNFPATPGAYDTSFNGVRDAAVVKLRADGGALLYATLLGGSGYDKAEDVALDAGGAIYVAVNSNSQNYPVTPGAFDTIAEDATNACVTKLSADGASLVYSTYLGGPAAELPVAIGVDGAGAAYVVGEAYATGFPTTPEAYDTSFNGGPDIFVAKLDTSGAALVYATYLGSTGSDRVLDAAVDAAGAVYVVGSTTSLAYPTTADALHTGPRGGLWDVVISRIGPTGGALEYSTYIGGNGDDRGYCVGLRDGGEVYIAGTTASSNFAAFGYGVRDSLSAFVLALDLLPGIGTDTVAIYAPPSGAWFLRNANAGGGADLTFFYGSGGGGLVALAGDWDGDGADTPGLYDPATGAFFLRDSSTPGPADSVFFFGVGGAGVSPLVGDWDGDGVDTVGVYSAATGAFFLKNSNAGGAADLVFFFGAGGAGVVPIAGDWDADGADTVGLHVVTTGAFFLRNQLDGGAADLVFFYGGAGATAIAGDWDGDGTDTVGIYAPAAGAWFLSNENAGGAADLTFFYGGPNAAPLSGDWDGQ